MEGSGDDRVEIVEKHVGGLLRERKSPRNGCFEKQASRPVCFGRPAGFVKALRCTEHIHRSFSLRRPGDEVDVRGDVHGLCALLYDC